MRQKSGPAREPAERVVSVGALQDLVYKGRGPVVTKIGRRTFFAVKDLEAFVDAHRQGL